MNWQMTFFQWAQLKHAISMRQKKLIFDYSDTNENDLYQTHHVNKGPRTLSINKLSSMEMYSILISNAVNKPIPNIYFENCLKYNSRLE